MKIISSRSSREFNWGYCASTALRTFLIVILLLALAQRIRTEWISPVKSEQAPPQLFVGPDQVMPAAPKLQIQWAVTSMIGGRA